MKIERWRPVKDLLSIHEDFDKLVKDFFGRKPELTERFQWNPEVDIIDKKDRFLIKADLPGLEKKDIDIFFTPSVCFNSFSNKYNLYYSRTKY